ncbi:MAG: ribonuclease BN/unknown domain fusion protein [candidate division BRC1 bacterium ADurb.BinA364]|nr:MAG: ribonuclease BN/unknown domain fusion protein [candidate division BRC1 bacterium ADurb.BinA364]
MVAAALWIAAQRCFFLYANASVFYRTVFGAFGATLVFLVWLYVLWAIILIGAEVAYLNQHLGIVLRERYMPLWKTMLDQRLILFVLARIGEAFARGEAGIEFDELRRRTALRDSDLEEIIEQLRQGGYVAGLEDGRLTVSRPLESIALADALGLGCQTAPLADEGNGPMRRALANLDQALPAALQGMSLADWLKPEKADA